MIKANETVQYCYKACDKDKPCACRDRGINYVVGIDPYDDKKSGDSFGG